MERRLGLTKRLAGCHAPENGDPLCPQPTLSRLENALPKSEIARMMATMVDLFCTSWKCPPASIALDIDDTCDTVHGGQQLSSFNAYCDRRCFLPIHIYEAGSGKPVAVIALRLRAIKIVARVVEGVARSINVTPSSLKDACFHELRRTNQPPCSYEDAESGACFCVETMILARRKPK